MSFFTWFQMVSVVLPTACFSFTCSTTFRALHLLPWVTEPFRSLAGALGAVTAAVEEGEGDEVVGIGEAVGDAGEDSDLGVR